MKNSEELDTDDKILNSIKNEFKTCKSIGQEINETSHRVYIRIGKLKMRGLVWYIQSQTSDRGVKPLKYKTK